MNWNITDYDNDGYEELLVLILKNNEADYDGLTEKKKCCLFTKCTKWLMEE